MSLILGIDTGGTYTDGVIMDVEKKDVLCKAKALTTKENLATGISNCLQKLNSQYFSDIELASLSTTLATNAIVEGRGGRVALIYMGADLDEELPEAISIKVKGRYDVMGNLIEDVDEKEVKEKIEKLRGKVEGIAISGYVSVRNARHEKLIKKWVEEILDIPTVCAHQLTTSLGFHQRTTTAILNAKLISIIKELIDSTKEVLNEKKIKAPIMLVKGDGTLMSEEMARKIPIETILSGPAASVIGGTFLTGERNAFVLDMGGTTTDIAHLNDGIVRTKSEGAKVGGWLTRVQAAEISTFGLGGDSRICPDEKGNILVGPQKVIPLSMAGNDYSNLIGEVRSFRRMGETKIFCKHEVDCYIYIKDDELSLSETEQEAVNIIKEAPHSLSYVAGKLKIAPEKLDLTSLVERGILGRAGLTPTDILHIRGTYTPWCKDIVQAAVNVFATRLGMEPIDFVKMVEKKIAMQMARYCMQSIADFEDQNFNFQDSKEAMYILNRTFEGGSNLFAPAMNLKNPIIAIGAPAEAWVHKAGECLNAKIIVPKHAEVANAIGAAVGRITASTEVVVSVVGNEFSVTVNGDREVYKTREEADFYAIHLGRQYVEEQLKAMGCLKWEINEDRQDSMLELQEGKSKTYVGSKYKIIGVGIA